MHYAEAYNEVAGPISTLLHSGNTAPFKEMSQLLQTLCPIWPARDLNLLTSTPETNALPLDQRLIIVD